MGLFGSCFFINEFVAEGGFLGLASLLLNLVPSLGKALESPKMVLIVYI